VFYVVVKRIFKEKVVQPTGDGDMTGASPFPLSATLVAVPLGLRSSSQLSIAGGHLAEVVALRVRSVASCARAMQAIFKSIEPMRKPGGES